MNSFDISFKDSLLFLFFEPVVIIRTQILQLITIECIFRQPYINQSWPTQLTLTALVFIVFMNFNIKCLVFIGLLDLCSFSSFSHICFYVINMPLLHVCYRSRYCPAVSDPFFFQILMKIFIYVNLWTLSLFLYS